MECHYVVTAQSWYQPPPLPPPQLVREVKGEKADPLKEVDINVSLRAITVFVAGTKVVRAAEQLLAEDTPATLLSHLSTV